MRKTGFPVILAGIALAGMISTGWGRAPYPAEARPPLFAYDHRAPLHLQETFVKKSGKAVISDITFSGKEGKSITAFLIKAENDAPSPFVIYLHWGQGNREEFLEEGIFLAGEGMSSILLEAPWFRPDYRPGTQDQGVVQIVTDIMRTVDLLYTLDFVDREKIAFVGHSYGATIGGIVAGVEKRITCHVLMAGYGRASKYTPEGYESPSEELDGVNFIKDSSPSPVFFQFARKDEYVPEKAALEFYNAAGKPKKIKWYDSGHRLNERAQHDRIIWLKEHFNIK